MKSFSTLLLVVCPAFGPTLHAQDTPKPYTPNGKDYISREKS